MLKSLGWENWRQVFQQVPLVQIIEIVWKVHNIVMTYQSMEFSTAKWYLFS